MKTHCARFAGGGGGDSGCALVIRRGRDVIVRYNTQITLYGGFKDVKQLIGLLWQTQSRLIGCLTTIEARQLRHWLIVKLTSRRGGAYY